jgi:hypothetical protein
VGDLEGVSDTPSVERVFARREPRWREKLHRFGCSKLKPRPAIALRHKAMVADFHPFEVLAWNFVLTLLARKA